MEALLVAVIGSVPASIAAFAALRSSAHSKKINAEIATGNGMTSGETQAFIKGELLGLRADFNQHRIEDDIRFQEIKDAMR